MSETVEVKSLSKISAKVLGNPKKGAALEKGQSHLLGWIHGTAFSTKTIVNPTDSRTSVGLVGNFSAVDVDGKETQSGICYLPAGFQEPIEAGINSGAVTFNLEIRTAPADNAAGYQYECTHLIPVAENEMASKMKVLIHDRMKKLKLLAPVAKPEK